MECFHIGFESLASFLPVAQTGSVFHLGYLMQTEDKKLWFIFLDACFYFGITAFGKYDRKSLFETMMSKSNTIKIKTLKL